MDSLPVIFDISSDDDELCEGNDYDWLSQVLSKSVDGSGDVVVVREANHWNRAKLSKGFDDDDDDDCVILNGDPEKSDGVVNENVNGNGNGNEELLIVGEKGQVACRDFPHSRQHCVKFPFSSTPHENHCSLCHCYVCDCIAPCSYWGKGGADYDHCHATEKEEKWKLQRENCKKRKRAPPSVPKLPYASQSVSLPQLNQASRMNQGRQFHQVKPLGTVQPSGSVIRSAFNPVMQNQVSRPSVNLPCTSSAFNPVLQNQGLRPNVTPSNPVMQNRVSRPNVILPRASSVSNPVTPVSGPNRVLPHTFLGSNPTAQNQVSRPIPNVILPCMSLASSPVMLNQALRPNTIFPFTPSPSGPFMPNQACNLTAAAVVRGCTNSKGHTALPGISRTRNQQQHKLAARQPECPGNSDLKHKEGDHGIGNPGTTHYGSSRSMNHARALQQPRISNLPSTQTMLDGRSWSVSMNPLPPGSCQSQNYSQPSTRNLVLNPAVPSQPQTQNQPFSHPNASQYGTDQQAQVPPQPQIQSQPLSHSNASQNGLHHQPPVPSLPQTQSQPLSHLNPSQTIYQSQNGIHQQPPVPSQPQNQSQPLSHPNQSQTIYQSQNGIHQQPPLASQPLNQSQPLSHPNPSQTIYQSQNGLHQQPQSQSQPTSHPNTSQPIDQSQNDIDQFPPGFDQSQNDIDQFPPGFEDGPDPPIPASSDQNLPSFDFNKWPWDDEPQQAATLDSGMLDDDLRDWFWGYGHGP